MDTPKPKPPLTEHFPDLSIFEAHLQSVASQHKPVARKSSAISRAALRDQALVAPLGLLGKNSYGESILHVAAKMDLALLCAALVDLKPSLLSSTDHFGLTPLMAACESGSMASIPPLVGGSELEARSITGKTAFLFACESSSNSSQNMRALLTAGADPKARTRSGANALHMACRVGIEDAIDMAMEVLGPAAFDERDTGGRTPIDLARGRMSAKAVAVLEARAIEQSIPAAPLSRRGHAL